MEPLTKEQAIVLSAYTNVFCCESFSDLHEAVEERLGRPVWTHQFADKELWEEIKEAFKEDFMSLIPKGDLC